MASESDLRPHQVMRLVIVRAARAGPPATSPSGSASPARPAAPRCPNACDPPRVIDALREISIEAGVATCRAPCSAFHKTFLEQIRANGRLHEVGLVVGYKLRSGDAHERRHQHPRPASARQARHHARQDQGSRRGQAHLREVRGDPMSTVVDATAEAAAVRSRPKASSPTTPAARCTAPSPEFDESLRAVVEALGIALAEIPDWNCCGASSGHTTDHLLGVALPARNLALAEAAGLRPRAGALRRLLQPPGGGAPRRRRGRRPGGADARHPRPPVRQHRRGAQRPQRAPRVRRPPSPSGRRPADDAQPARRASSWPRTTAACSSARRRSAATTTPSSRCPWTRSSPPAAPRPSTGT